METKIIIIYPTVVIPVFTGMTIWVNWTAVGLCLFKVSHYDASDNAPDNAPEQLLPWPAVQPKQ